MDDVISLGVGEPDFPTPWHVRQVGIKSIEDGCTFYTANSGLMELREEICNYLKRRFSVEYKPESEVLVTVGGSEAIDGFFRSVVAIGDEVIIPEPSFVCYAPLVTLCGGIPVPVETYEKDEFCLDPEVLKSKITSKTKALVLPFPNNPTGAVMSRKQLEDIAEVIKDTDILVISDEIYGELTYTEEGHVSFPSIPGMWERTVLVSGFSKAYSMTGWRLGYACGPKEIIAQMTKIHQFGIMSAPTTAQYAAIEALKNGDEDIAKMRAEYDRRRKLVVNGFRSVGMDCFEPRGAFYVFPSVKKLGMTSEEFCQRLLESKHVAVVPGDAFGKSGQGNIRVSYSYSVKHLKTALERIGEFIKEL
ncbi:MAG: aminotransferase class I/II-fold pyridoxal phosphate-dependent enzyme [Clostridia bacterium]|nr:aminotransferase class I/II-fold pyridoxal phosphate-dependent enzyme [Clostridia bacterium]